MLHFTTQRAQYVDVGCAFILLTSNSNNHCAFRTNNMCCRRPYYQPGPYYGEPVACPANDYDYACRPRSQCVVSTRDSRNTYYVDPAGKDTNPGSIKRPFRTIQRALDVSAEAFVASGVIKNVEVLFGKYTENLTITKPVQLTGATESQVAGPGSSIVGSITINVSGTSDVTQSQVGIFGFQIDGAITDTSTTVHNVVLQNVNVVSLTDRALYVTSTAPAAVWVIEHSTITNSTAVVLGTNPLVEFATGIVTVDNSTLTANGVQQVFALTGSASLDIAQFSTFENTNSSTTLPPVIRIATTSYSNNKTFYSNIIQYTTTASRTPSASPAVNLAISIVLGVTASFYYIINNYISLLGTTAGAVVITYETSTGVSGTAYYLNNSAGWNPGTLNSTGNAIAGAAGGWTKQALTAVA